MFFPNQDILLLLTFLKRELFIVGRWRNEKFHERIRKKNPTSKPVHYHILSKYLLKLKFCITYLTLKSTLSFIDSKKQPRFP